MLTREDILSKKALKTEVVDVPEWGGSVTVREMMAEEADIFEAALAASRETGQNGTKHLANMPTAFRARLVSICAVDDQGKRLFTDQDVDELGKLSRAALDKVSTVAARLSGYGTEPDKKKDSLPDASSSTASH